MDGTNDRDLYDIDWDNPDVAKLFQEAIRARFKKGDVILDPSNETRYVHTVLAGLVKLCTIDTRGVETTAIIYGRGDIFPIGWLIQERHHDAYFQALTDCEVALIPKDIFAEKIKTNADLSFAILKKLSEQIYVYAARANNLGLRYARERLAYRLLVLGARFGTKTPDGGLMLPHITQQDMASAINVSRENVNREVTRLERKNVITYARSGIIIHKPNLLRNELSKSVQVLFFDDSLIDGNHSAP